MEILIKSILGGAVIGLILLIGQALGSRAAGVIGGIPIASAIGYVMLTLNDKTPKTVSGYMQGSLWAMIPSVLFYLFLWYISTKMPHLHWINFAAAYALCIAIAAGIVWFTSN